MDFDKNTSQLILVSSLVLLVGCFTTIPLYAQIYTDLRDFNCTTNGCQPYFSGILAQGQDGNLYGTLQSGGTFNNGTVFKITPAGTITTLYNFAGGDGSAPVGGLTLGTDGNFYGTTYIIRVEQITMAPFSRLHLQEP